MPDVSIIITSGEPAGVGPDIIAAIDPARFDARLVVIGDFELLAARAAALGSGTEYIEYGSQTVSNRRLEVIHQPLAHPCVPGRLDSANAEYVLQLLERACRACLSGEFDAMVTAPVQKEIINRAGIDFSGHTEFLAGICEVPKPV
ncbi:MAG: 4-hydroxythreonine-4-phosphate dehydrogenase PdxA, partial [Gammaproteobacteria bacterium]